MRRLTRQQQTAPPSRATDTVGTQQRTEEQEQFRTYVERFLTYLSSVRNLSENTVRAYRTDLEAYCDWAEREGMRPLEVTHRQLRRFLGELSRARYASKTINRHLSAVRALYRWLVHEGITDKDSAAAVASPKLARTLPKTMTDADAAALMETCDTSDVVGVRDRAFLELLYASGARISEVSGLDVRDIDVSNAQVRLFGKGSKERIVPLYDTCLEWLRTYLSTSRPQLAAHSKDTPTQALFVSTRGNRMSANALRTCFERHATLAGLDGSLTPHAMRHTYATELLAGGADMRSVQELLGHASLSTTQIYTHLSVDRLRDAARQAHPRGE